MNATPALLATTWGRKPHAPTASVGNHTRADDPKTIAGINPPAQLPIRPREVDR